jgi:hypothetical protein
LPNGEVALKDSGRRNQQFKVESQHIQQEKTMAVRQPGQSDADFAEVIRLEKESGDAKKAKENWTSGSDRITAPKPISGDFINPEEYNQKLKEWRMVVGYDKRPLVSTPQPPVEQLVAPSAPAPAVLAPKPVPASPVAALMASPAPVVDNVEKERRAGIEENNRRFAETQGTMPVLPTRAPAPVVAAPAPAPASAPLVGVPGAEQGFLRPSPMLKEQAPSFIAAEKPKGRDQGQIDADIARLMAPYQGNTGIIPSAISQKLLELNREKSGSTAETRMVAGLAERARGAALADKAVASMDERRSLEQRAKVAGVKPEVQAANEKAANEVADGRAAEQKKVETEVGGKVAAARGAGAEAAATDAESRKAVAQITADVAKANSLADLEKMTKAAELDANSPLNKAQVEAIKAKTAHLPEEDRLEMMKAQLQLAAFQHQQQKETAAAALKERESTANIEQSQAKTKESGQNAVEKERENALAAAGFSKQTDPETKASRWYKGNVIVEPGSALDTELSGIQARFGGAPAAPTATAAAPSGRPRSASGKFEWDGQKWIPIS